MTHNDYNQWICYDKSILNKASDANTFIIGIKDCFETKDFPTTDGTPALAGYTNERDAEVVARLRNAGCEIAGKNNLHELGFGITSNNYNTGSVKNPHNPEYIAGGSSGGAGAAVGSGQVRACIGTDCGGSVRIPSSLCGTYGFRPSTPRYPDAGLLKLSPTRDTGGPIATNMQDICYLDSIMVGKQTHKKSVNISSVRLGIPDKEFLGVMDPEVETIFDTTCAKLQQAGITLVTISFAEIVEINNRTGMPIVFYETAQIFPKFIEKANLGITMDTFIDKIASPDVQQIFRNDIWTISKQEYDYAINIDRPKMQALYAQIFTDNNLNGVIMPTTPVFARKIGEDATITVQGQQLPTFPTYIRFTDVNSVLGVPSLSMPMGVGTQRLPIGLLIDGLQNEDESLLSLATAVDKIVNPK